MSKAKKNTVRNTIKEIGGGLRATGVIKSDRRTKADLVKLLCGITAQRDGLLKGLEIKYVAGYNDGYEKGISIEKPKPFWRFW